MIDWSKISLKDLAGYVAEELRKNNIDTVLVGGACVTIYSNNRYTSYDLDFITYDEMKKVRNVLVNLGFEKKNKYFQHPGCKWFVEFVSPPVSIGNEPVDKFNQIQTKLGEIKLLTPVDCVKDRLAGFYYWDDKQGLAQAINICLDHKINLNEVKRWSEAEGQLEKFEIFKSRVTKAKQ